MLRQISLSLDMTTCFHKYTPPEGQTQVIACDQSMISLIHCLFRLVKCKFTEPHYKSAWYTLLSLLIFSTYALSIKREGRNLTKKKKKEISRLLRLLHSSAVMLSKARYCDIAVTATALSARVSRGVRHCFLTMFTYCVRLVCHSFAISYFHWKTKMLPHK